MSTMSKYFDPTKIPQDVITGIIVTFIGLVILFYIKPRLEIAFTAAGPPKRGKLRAAISPFKQRFFARSHSVKGTTESSDTAAFVVRNMRAMQVIEVQARLFRMKVCKGSSAGQEYYTEREAIKLKTSELFQLSGWATLSRKRAGFYGPRSEFRFHACEPIAPLKDWEYLLFQVRAKHGFTGLGRVAIQKWYLDNGAYTYWDEKKNPFTKRIEQGLELPPEPEPPAPQGPPAGVVIVAASALASVFAAFIAVSWILTGQALIALFKLIRNRGGRPGPRG